MSSIRSARRQFMGWGAAILFASLLAGKPARGQSGDDTSLIVSVTDASSNHPIFQARLTLQFNKKGGKLKNRGLIEYSAKTNPQGHYRFTHIPFGTMRLIVTAQNHQTFSEEFQLTKPNQVIAVKMKPPHPLL
ncbi:MAG TPA: carboxypeptidase-like regulatory domain-containing protein [Terriglobia bacterium]|nr:carboxypeptidase-like regulatory domain-containing protein [Terriglobia bacterium]